MQHNTLCGSEIGNAELLILHFRNEMSALALAQMFRSDECVHMRQRLSVGGAGSGAPGGSTVILAGLRNGRCITAQYNGGKVVLAPYLLYERHDVPHLAAVTVNREGRALAADKLSVYRISGLTDISLTGRTFRPDPQLLESHTHPVDRLVGSALEAQA